MNALADVPELPKRLVAPYRFAFRHGIKLGLFIGIPFALFNVFCEFLAVGPLPVPVGTDYLMGTGKLLFVLCILPILFVAVYGLFFLPFKSSRFTGIEMIVVAIIGFALWYGSLDVSDWIRNKAFTAVAENAQPLVNAIQAFEKDTGAPPPTLNTLVPNYLSEVPGTGMGSCPRFDYAAKGLLHRPTGSWYLGFDTTDSGVLDFDAFFYEPTADWEAGERFGDWVYLHD